MLKRIFTATRITAAILMVASVFTPVQIAEASGTITKSVTVLGPNGQPYEGALVELAWQPTVGSTARTSTTTPVTTNASGVATLTFADDITSGQIYVQPPVSDTATALYANYSGNMATSASLTVNLKKASVLVRMLTFDGQEAPANGGIANGFKEWYQTVRTGVAGINIPSTAPTNTCAKFQAIAADSAVGSFRRVFGSKITGTGDAREVRIYNDATTCTVETPKINGVYQLTYNAGNVSGNLLTNAGGALTFGTGEGYDLNMIGANSDGSRNYNVNSAMSYVNNDGSWSTYVDTTTAGKYELIFSGYGSLSLPSFARKYLYVTSDHKLSWNADGTSSATTLTRNYNLPTSNFTLSFIDSATNTGIASYFDVRKKISGTTYDDYASWSFNSGRAAFFLEDGEYTVSGSAMSGTGDFNLKVNVVSGAATVSNDSLATHSFIGINYTVWMPPSNVRIMLVDSASAPVRASVDFCSNSGSCYHGESSVQGLVSMYVPNGTYQNIWVQPGANEELAQTKYAGSITGGSLAITGKTPVDGVFTLTLPTANVKFNVVNPLNQALILGGYLSIETADSSWNGTGWYGNADISGMIPGYTRASLANGRYLITVNVFSGMPENAGLASKTYRALVTNGAVQVFLGETEIQKDSVTSRFPLTLSTSNFDVQLNDLSGNGTNQGWIEYCQDLGGGNVGMCRGNGVDQNGRVSLSLAAGNWIIRARPSGDNTTWAMKSYNAVVNSSGVVTSVSGSSLVNGRWVITGATPNLSGTFTAGGSPVTFAGDQGIVLNLQKYVNDHWEWQDGGNWLTSSNWVVNVTAQGHYRFVAQPQNFSDLVTTDNVEFWVDGTGKASLTEVGGYATTLSNIVIAMATPNLKFKVTNPNDGSLLQGGWIQIDRVTNNGRNWYGNADISFSNPGLTGYNIREAGDYILIVNPPNGRESVVGLAARQYNMIVGNPSDPATFTITSGSTAIQKDNDGRFGLSPAAANITARIVKSDGTVISPQNGKWVSVNLQKYNTNTNNWEYGTWGNTDQDGYVSLRAETEGKYRLRIEPNGDPDATITYSSELNFTSENLDVKQTIGELKLGGPAIRVSVATIDAPTSAIRNVGIEIRKDGMWLDWVGTNNSGVAAVNLSTEGTYEFVVYPGQSQTGSSSKKTYKIVATKDSNGVISATAVTADGVSLSGNITFLLLGLPTLSGTVKDPTGATNLANAQVYARDINTGREMWEYSIGTNQSGAWGMSLPEGSYQIFARAPYGSSTYGNSDPVGDETAGYVVVNAAGVATSVTTNYSANAFNIRLKAPRWTGVVKNPEGTAIVPNARICLRLSNVFNCINADRNGAWAMSAPSTFTSFTGTNPYLEINDDYTRQYTQTHFDGEQAVFDAIGTTGTGITLKVSNPNTKIQVLANGQPVANVWVNAERDNVGWLGGASTDGNGYARLNITDSRTAFSVRVDLNGNPAVATNFAASKVDVTASDFAAAGSIVDGVFTKSISLSPPNFRIAVNEPNSDGSLGAPVSYTWVELYSETEGKWLAGSTTDVNGFASFILPAPVSGLNQYTVTVNPRWDGTSIFSKKSYAVAINSNSEITVVNKISTNAVNKQSINGRDAYPLMLGNPSITGVVVDPNNHNVANSWVVPIDASTSEYFWQLGTNTRANGSFGIAVTDGSYKLEANIPWGTSEFAKSAKCEVSVSGGTISTGGSCVQGSTSKTVVLPLRLPNVTLTLKIDGNPVANANVSVGAGSWWTNAQSNSEGKVSLFIDADAVRAAVQGSGSRNIHIWVDPPYGTSDMARWDCDAGDLTKPICSGLEAVPASGPYPTKTLGNVTGVSPNTRFKIVAPGTTTQLPNSWVTILTFTPNTNYGWRWLAGGNSGANGYVSFNLDTATVGVNERYMIEVNAPWNQRSTYATKMWNNSGDGYTWDQLVTLIAGNLSPATPNLKLTISTASAVANKWGWIAVEQVDGSYNPIKWIGGYGLNDEGKSAIYLPSGSQFRITAYPGSGKSGARTTCVVSTVASSTPTPVTGKCTSGTFTGGDSASIALKGGNVVGMVKRADNTVVVGAIVYANRVGATGEGTAVITSTGSDGRYGLQLDPAYDWDIKFFTVSKADENLAPVSRTAIRPPAENADPRDLDVSFGS